MIRPIAGLAKASGRCCQLRRSGQDPMHPTAAAAELAWWGQQLRASNSWADEELDPVVLRPKSVVVVRDASVAAYDARLQEEAKAAAAAAARLRAEKAERKAATKARQDSMRDFHKMGKQTGPHTAETTADASVAAYDARLQEEAKAAAAAAEARLQAEKADRKAATKARQDSTRDFHKWGSRRPHTAETTAYAVKDTIQDPAWEVWDPKRGSWQR
ncbi:hypothetical protein DIPPA_23251 [Diplonema papillatum]|nr:hypothetical protein DIPPA_23251 [Diplonema papillatum]